MKQNVLVTAASRRVALVTALRDALRRHAPGGLVIAADISPWSPAVHVADAARRVPRSDAGDYIDALLAICDADDIGLLVPTIDDELAALSAARERFDAVGVCVAVSPLETTRICRDKALTAAHLSAHGVPVATTWTPDSLDLERAALPLFIKPRRGRGSVGAYPVKTREELAFFLKYVPDPVIQQYLPPPEYTVDMFCDMDGRLLSVVPRERQVIRAGVTDRGCTVSDGRLIALAERCAAALPFRGAANVQCRIVDGIPTIFEINPRFSGGIQLTMAAGANFADWLVRLSLGEHLEPCIGAFVEGLYMSSYETSLFFAGRPDDVLVTTPGRRTVPIDWSDA